MLLYLILAISFVVIAILVIRDFVPILRDLMPEKGESPSIFIMVAVTLIVILGGITAVIILSLRKFL